MLVEKTVIDPGPTCIRAGDNDDLQVSEMSFRLNLLWGEKNYSMPCQWEQNILVTTRVGSLSGRLKFTESSLRAKRFAMGRTNTRHKAAWHRVLIQIGEFDGSIEHFIIHKVAIFR
jgi:hypothetical protein